MASRRIVNGTLECPLQEDPHPYRDLPVGFSKRLQDALFSPWIIGRSSMTAWEARIVGEEWAPIGPVVRRHARAGDPPPGVG